MKRGGGRIDLPPKSYPQKRSSLIRVKKPRVANFADIIKITAIFVEKTFKDSINFKLEIIY